MARVSVQVARQRYAQVPKLGTDGQPVVITVNRKTKRGREIKRRVMVNDYTRPLDARHCERCQAPLVVGQKYKSISIKRQYGGITRFRCMTCPSWMPWEISSSLGARIMQIQSEDIGAHNFTEEDDAESRASELAEMIRELAEEKEEAASNIEDGFGHSTYQSDELNDQAEQLNSWADEVESSAGDVEFPEGHCPNCGGEEMSHDEHSPECDEDCDGTEECLECNGADDGGEPSAEELEEWQSEVEDAIRSALDNSPL